MNFLNRWRSPYPSACGQVGCLCFQLGLFLLPSSALLSGIFFITSLIFGPYKSIRAYLNDSWNIPFLLAGILMCFGALKAYSGWLAWIGLANWIPFFWAFWGFQPYLLTLQARRHSALLLVAGTFPVVITGFGQLWFDWQGPWSLLNGLIIWFISPGGNPTGRLSGLFDYANIAGAWLALIWPFCLAFLLQPSISSWRRFFVLIFTGALVVALVLTDSRNAWGGLILAIPFVIGAIHWNWFLPLLTLFLMPVVFAVFPWFGLDLQQWARNFVPEGLWARLNDMRYVNERSLESTRLSQWTVAIKFIAERPLFGWGAAAFSVLYPLLTGFWHGHAHNFPLEIAVSHGVFVSLLITGTIIYLLIVAIKRGVLKEMREITRPFLSKIFDRAWWAATLIMVFLHGSDMPFFDSRINILGWILLAGLRCLIIPSRLKDDFEILLDVESKARF